MLGQDNDPSSLRNIGNRISTLNVTQKLKEDFARSHTEFNAYLNSAPNIRVEGVGADTNRIIFETFMYGKYAHHNKNHLARLDAWCDAPFFADLEAQFDIIVSQFLHAAQAMAAQVRAMLKENF